MQNINSIQFILSSPISQITNVPQWALESVHIPFPSLTFDLTLDQEKLPKNRKNPFTGKKGKKPSGKKRGGSLSRMDRTIDVMCTCIKCKPLWVSEEKRNKLEHVIICDLRNFLN